MLASTILASITVIMSDSPRHCTEAEGALICYPVHLLIRCGLQVYVFII